MNWPSWTRTHHAPDSAGTAAGADVFDMAAVLSGGGSHLLRRPAQLGVDVADIAVDQSVPPTAGLPADQDEHVRAGWTAWPVEGDRYTANCALARPYPLLDETAERAWSERLDDAVQGMDALDPDGLDGWMQVHAESPVPHLYEARLVAAWETQQATTEPDASHINVDDSADRAMAEPDSDGWD